MASFGEPRSTANWPSIAALLLVHGVGVNAMFGFVYRNGYIGALIDLYKYGPYVLPGSENPILTRFCGIGPVDKLLTLAGVMFANVVDGSTPELSLYGFHFAGQLVPIFTVMVIESLREGNRGTVFSFSLPWGLAMQALGYGTIMPIYSCAHLALSSTAGAGVVSTARAIRVPVVEAVRSLPTSLSFGYFLPSILMALPMRSTVLKQWFGGLWQGFPAWVSLSQSVAGAVTRSKKASANQPPSLKDQSSSVRAREAAQLRRAYNFAIGAAAVCHLESFAIIGSKYIFSSQLSPQIQEALTFSRVFVPAPFFSNLKMTSMASAIHHFFEYDQYVGSVAALIWATTLNLASRKSPRIISDLFTLLARMIGYTIFAGPAGTLVFLMKDRDLRLILDDDLFKP